MLEYIVGFLVRFISILALVLLAVPASAFTLRGVTIGNPDVPGAEYATVVIFGDSQRNITGSDAIDGGGDYQQINDMVTWVIDNKDSEDIDLVIHVGDMIDAGNNLPLSDGCDSDLATPDVLTCAAENGNGEAACDAIAGCGYAAHNGNCAPCTKVDDALSEWGRFDTVFSRLEGEVPFIFAKGNHDNSGSQAGFADRDTSGYDDYYDDTFWNARETDFSAWNYDHLQAEALLNSGIEGVNRAFLTDIGGVQMLVVVIAARSGALSDSTNRQWAIDTMANYPGTPAILVSHYIGPTQIPSTILDVSESVAPTLIWAAGGHTTGNSVEISTNGGESVLETVTDWTDATSVDTGSNSQNDYITLVRIYYQEDPTELAVRDYSPTSGLFENGLGAGNRVDRQDFDIYPPILADPLFALDAPYDLRPYVDDVVTVFGSDPVNFPDWPTEPSGLTDCNVTAGSESSLNSCLSAGNRRVIVPAGTYDTSFTLNDDNVWFDADDDAVFNGGFSISGDTVKMTGGQYYEGTAALAFSNSDVLIDNVYVEMLDQQEGRSVTFTQFLGTTVTRLAVVNSTFRASRPAGLFAQDSDANNVILANVDMWSDFVDTVGQSGNPEYAWRIQTVDDLIMVDSQARVQSLDTPENDKPALRLHYGGDNHLYTNNIYQCGNPCLRPVWIDTDAGTGEDRSHTNIHLIANRFETLQTGAQDDIQIDDSAGGGATNEIFLTDNVAAAPGNAVFQVGGNDSGSATLSGNTGEVNGSLTIFSGGAARTSIWPNGL